MCLCLASAADVSAVTKMNDGGNKMNLLLNLFLFRTEDRITEELNVIQFTVLYSCLNTKLNLNETT